MVVFTTVIEVKITSFSGFFCINIGNSVNIMQNLIAYYCISKSTQNICYISDDLWHLLHSKTDKL